MDLTCEKVRAYIEYERLVTEILCLQAGLTIDEKSDKLEERYAGQPRKKNGQFDFGKAKLSAAEYYRVSSGILTDYPNLKNGNGPAQYEYGDYIYTFSVIEPGTYKFHRKTRIKGRGRNFKEKRSIQMMWSDDDLTKDEKEFIDLLRTLPYPHDENEVLYANNVYGISLLATETNTTKELMQELKEQLKANPELTLIEFAKTIYTDVMEIEE